MNSYKSSAELKGIAKEQLFGKYGAIIGPSLVLGLITLILSFGPGLVVGTNTVPQLILYFLISFIVSLFAGIFTSGKAFLYLKLTCGQPVSVSDIFYGFQTYPDKALLIQLVLSVVTYVCMIPQMIFNLLINYSQNMVAILFASLFTVIGSAVMIFLMLMLSQSFYLLHDFPQYSAKDLMKMSCRMMKGHKGRLFYINVSFLPLYFLGFFSCCIAFLWLNPYMEMVRVNFYMDLMKNRNSVNLEKQPAGRETLQ